MYLNHEDALEMYIDEGHHSMFTVGTVLKDPITRKIGIIVCIKMSFHINEIIYSVEWEEGASTSFTSDEFIKDLENKKPVYIIYQTPLLSYHEIKKLMDSIKNDNDNSKIGQMFAPFKDGGEFADCETLLITKHNDGYMTFGI